MERKQTTMVDLQKALDSQISYFSEYASNLEALKAAAEEYGIDLSGVWGRLSDGSTESAAAVAAMVGSVKNGDVTELEKYAGAYAELQNNLKALSDIVAQEDEKFIAALEQAEKDIVEAVEETEAYNEAYEAMQTTIQGFLDGLEDGTGPVTRAIERAGEQWKQAIITSFENYLDTRDAYGDEENSIQYVGGGAYIVNGRYVKEGGFASGTDNAPPGWAWVGEEGPELMRLHGGEQILPAEISRRLAEDYDAYNHYTAVQGVQQTRTLEVTGSGTTATAGTKVEVHVHVEAGAPPETVDVWQEYAMRGELKATILEVMEDAEADRKRRAFS